MAEDLELYFCLSLLAGGTVCHYRSVYGIAWNGISRWSWGAEVNKSAYQQGLAAALLSVVIELTTEELV